MIEYPAQSEKQFRLVFEPHRRLLVADKALDQAF
jgi:hypothetical protein